MIQRGGEVVIRMPAEVKQATIGPLVRPTIAVGSTIYTDEYDINARLKEWGYGHETVCHAASEYAWDDDGNGFCEVHVNRMEEFSGPCCVPGTGPTEGSLRRPCRSPGVLRVRAQREGSWEAVTGCPDRSIADTTPEYIMSQMRNPSLKPCG